MKGCILCGRNMKIVRLEFSLFWKKTDGAFDVMNKSPIYGQH